MENRQQRRLDRQEEYDRRLLHRRYSSSLLWMWIGVSVLVILLLLWLTILSSGRHRPFNPKKQSYGEQACGLHGPDWHNRRFHGRKTDFQESGISHLRYA